MVVKMKEETKNSIKIAFAFTILLFAESIADLGNYLLNIQ